MKTRDATEDGCIKMEEEEEEGKKKNKAVRKIRKDERRRRWKEITRKRRRRKNCMKDMMRNSGKMKETGDEGKDYRKEETEMKEHL